MKNIYGILGVCLLLSMGLVVARDKAQTQTGKQSYDKVDLFEKDANWGIVEDGAYGWLVYSGNQFAFNGRGLDAGVEYTLIRHTDPWGTEDVCLGAGTARNNGNLVINGEFVEGGEKVWLVLSEDFDCETGFSAWNPSEYLFENNLI